MAKTAKGLTELAIFGRRVLNRSLFEEEDQWADQM